MNNERDDAGPAVQLSSLLSLVLSSVSLLHSGVWVTDAHHVKMDSQGEDGLIFSH